ncbi:hypothetical protein CLV62_10755 [Dysgonomonas alginatilytica]|uniref:HTH cro/C1-type domain-containing protein n=1 Tax=Dysgonomonas alginatilytica TaxID=1605892 RepID=A0A2V3PQ01_9BACT|nr:helix-turn-helix transcriptional regulator [Dysgonomonas alginatilytica]PXV65463.1 hypothetical protein CLV62_10755 [Dysgonomonas alginatilytica]
MKEDNLNESKHLGENVKHLMRAFHLQQNDLAENAGYSESQLSNVLRKADIDDESLERLAKGLGNGVTTDMIKAYNHEDTVSYIINNYTQTVADGGKGTLQQNNKFQEGSAQTQTNYNYPLDDIKDLYERLLKEKDKQIEDLKAKL